MLKEASITILVVGILLLMPPLITLFNSVVDWINIPLVVIYIFGTWLALIICAFLLSLSKETADSEQSKH